VGAAKEAQTTILRSGYAVSVCLSSCFSFYPIPEKMERTKKEKRREEELVAKSDPGTPSFEGRWTHELARMATK
jgi:hypothetical protein